MASSLDRWLATLSRRTLAALAIGGGILFIIMTSPPRTVCDSQIDHIREQQKGFLFADKSPKGQAKPIGIKSMTEYCRQGRGPGACYELFARIRSLTRDLELVPQECAEDVGAVSEVKGAIKSSLSLITQLAWGEKAPGSLVEKLAWMDVADVALFCGLKRQAIRLYGDSFWESMREQLMKDLPGAKDLPRKDVWEKSIVSEDCQRFL